MTSKELFDFDSGLQLYRRGRYEEAYMRFRQCELPESKFYIGLSFEKGNGVAQDINEALNWYVEAAEHGHPGSMFRLGQIYDKGTGVAKNLRMARHWYGMGAKAGNQGCIDRLDELSEISNSKSSQDKSTDGNPDKKEIDKAHESSGITDEHVTKDISTNASDGHTSTVDENHPSSPQEQKNRNKILPIICGLLCIACIGGYLFHSQGMETEKDEINDTSDYLEQTINKSNEPIIDMSKVSKDSENTDHRTSPMKIEDHEHPNSSENTQEEPSKATEADVTNRKDSETRLKSKDDLFASATTIQDFKKLADKGYKKAYAPLAELYLKQRDYDNAHIWALKAGESNTDVKKACRVISVLEKLDYYHNGAHGGLPEFYRRNNK